MGDTIANSILERIFESIKKGLVVDKALPTPIISEKVAKTNRRWTKNENLVILEYLADTIKKGYSIEKPNATIYYQKFLDKNPTIKVKPYIVKNKVRNFRTIYFKAMKWQGETGQGIKEIDGELTFQEVFNKKFPYQSLCEEIFGGRLNVIVPKKSESRQIGRPPFVVFNCYQKTKYSDISNGQDGDRRETTEPNIERAYDIETIVSGDSVDRGFDHVDDNDEPDLGVVDGAYLGVHNEANLAIHDEANLGDHDVEPDLGVVDGAYLGVHDEANLAVHDEANLGIDEEGMGGVNEANLGDHDDVDMCDDEEDEAPLESVRTTMAVTSAISKASKRLLRKVTKGNQIKTGKSAYETITKAKDEAFERKLYIETEKLEFEKFKFHEQQKHIEKQVEREFLIKEKEIEFKRLQCENQKQIRLEELQVEKLKWKAVLAQHGISNF